MKVLPRTRGKPIHVAGEFRRFEADGTKPGPKGHDPQAGRPASAPQQGLAARVAQRGPTVGPVTSVPVPAPSRQSVPEPTTDTTPVPTPPLEEAPQPHAVPAPPPEPSEPDSEETMPDDALTGRLQRLEATMERLHDLRELSEILSVKYNPFLSLDEASSEQKVDVHGLLEHQLTRKPDPELDKALGQMLRPDPPARKVHSDIPGVPGQAAQPYPSPLEQASQAPPVPQAPQAPAAEHTRQPEPEPAATPPAAPASDPRLIAPPPREHADQGEPAPLPPHGIPPREGPKATEAHDFKAARGLRGPTQNDAPNRALFHARGPLVGGPRESFLALNWFTYLGDGTDPSIIFLYLDYYRYTGWIDAEHHTWLYRLAEGVATPKPEADWNDYGMDTRRLADKHLRNLRFLDKLLGTTLQHGEADYLQQTLDMLLED